MRPNAPHNNAANTGPTSATAPRTRPTDAGLSLSCSNFACAIALRMAHCSRRRNVHETMLPLLENRGQTIFNCEARDRRSPNGIASVSIGRLRALRGVPERPGQSCCPRGSSGQKVAGSMRQQRVPWSDYPTDTDCGKPVGARGGAWRKSASLRRRVMNVS